MRFQVLLALLIAPVAMFAQGGAGTISGSATDATGGYQISNVTPGNLIAVANKSGYASAPGSGNLAVGGTLIFSPSLLPVTQSAGAAIELSIVGIEVASRSR